MNEIKWTDKTPLNGSGRWLSDSDVLVIKDSNEVIQEIKSTRWPYTFSGLVENYIKDEIERFCNFNHISKRAWKKRGIITKEPATLELQVYCLYYKTRFRACKHEIKFSFQITKCNLKSI